MIFSYETSLLISDNIFLGEVHIIFSYDIIFIFISVLFSKKKEKELYVIIILYILYLHNIYREKKKIFIIVLFILLKKDIFIAVLNLF